MSVTRYPPDGNDWIECYRAGASLAKLAKQYRAAAETVRWWLIEAGEPIRDRVESSRSAMRTLRRRLPLEDSLVRLYHQGVSIKRLGELNGIDRSAITRRLRDAGVPIRGRSESMYIRMAQTTAKDRQWLTAAANAVQRGVPKTWDDLCTKAIGRQQRLSHVAPAEQMLAKWLRQRGAPITPQLAIGPYNVDIGIHEPPIAVEIFGGGFHGSGKHAIRMHKRTKYLLNQGWTLIIVWVDGRADPLTEAVADYVVALAQQPSSDPSIRSRYRVIGGNAQPATVRSTHFNDDAFIEALGRRD